MGKERQLKATLDKDAIKASSQQLANSPLSRRRFLEGGILGLGSAMLAASPLRVHAQQLEPFTPSPNSLSSAPGQGIHTGKPKVIFTEEMRDYVIAISRWAKSYRSDFSIIAINALELTEYLEKTLVRSEERSVGQEGTNRRWQNNSTTI